MEQELTYQNKTYNVKLEPDGDELLKADGFKVSIEDDTLRFNVSRISENNFSFIIDNQSKTFYAVQTDDEIYIHFNGRVIKFSKDDDSQKNFAGDVAGFGVKDEITTPMPGKVVKIIVNEGDRIETGQPLVIVESMKMENQINSPVNGSVKSIHFQAGDLVNPDQPIIKLQPDE